jgi:hypothetical protein
MKTSHLLVLCLGGLLCSPSALTAKSFFLADPVDLAGKTLTDKTGKPLTDESGKPKTGCTGCIQFRPSVIIPALKIVESMRPNVLFDAQVLSSVGGGVSFQFSTPTADDDPSPNTYFSISPLTILVNSDTASAGTPLNISWAGTIGFFNDAIMFGGGYDFGDIGLRHSRWFGLLSIGINFNTTK